MTGDLNQFYYSAFKSVGDEKGRSLTDGIAEVGMRTGTGTGGPVVRTIADYDIAMVIIVHMIAKCHTQDIF